MLRQNTSTSLLNLSIGDGGGSHGQTQSQFQSLDMDALPKQFVLSMKKLFDILDDKQSGYVRFTDIQKGWQDDGSKGLPRGVLDSLRRVTPSSGLLSFERFCAGLKLCLLRNQQQAVEDLKMRPRSQVNLAHLLRSIRICSSCRRPLRWTRRTGLLPGAPLLRLVPHPRLLQVLASGLLCQVRAPEVGGRFVSSAWTGLASD